VAIPSTNYTDNIIDIDVLNALVGTDYQMKTAAFQSGLLSIDSRPLPTGTQMVDVRRRFFEDEYDGQANGTAGEINFKDVKDISNNSPVIFREDGVSLFDKQGLIQPGGKIDPAALAEDIRIKAAQMIDTAALRVLEGVSAAVTANQYGTGAVLTLAELNAARWIREDFGDAFNGGLIVMRSELMQKAHDLGLVAATSNTWGADAQNQIAQRGMIQTIQGMFPIISNKLSLSGTSKQYAYLCEKGAITFRGGVVPYVESVRMERSLGYRIKLMVRFALGVKGVSYSGSFSDIYENSDLSTSSNWTLKAAYAKHVPIARFHTNQS